MRVGELEGGNLPILTNSSRRLPRESGLHRTAEATILRQPQIYQHQIGPVLVGELADQTYRLVRIFRHDHFAGFAEQLPDDGHGDKGVLGIVFDQKDPNTILRKKLIVAVHIAPRWQYTLLPGQSNGETRTKHMRFAASSRHIQRREK